jgi:hypothetical protein
MSDAFGYADLRETAEELIAEAGQRGVIRRPSPTMGDPWNPTPAGDPVDDACVFVELEYAHDEIDGTLVQATDRKLLVSTAGLTAAPTPECQLVIGPLPLEIVSVKPLAPGGLVLLWEVQARS